MESRSVKIQTGQGWISIMPGKSDVISGLRFDVLLGEIFENIDGHAKRTSWVKLFSFQEVAVGAIQVADGPPRLGHKMKRS